MPHVAESIDAPQLRSRTLRVLIADHHIDVAHTLAMVMSLEGHAVAIARRGEDALQLTHKIRPDVAILDLGMPGLDGYTVAQRIRRTYWGASILLLALTGFGEAMDKLRTRNSGFDDHFTKPVGPSQLLCRIAAWQLSKSPLIHEQTCDV